MCRRSPRARTRCSSRPSTATSGASVARHHRARPAAGVFEDLVRCSDAVYSNLRGDVPPRDRDHLRRPQAPEPGDRLLLPHRIRDDRARASASPATTTSSRASPAGCRSTGEPGGPPTKTGLSLVDYSGGYVAALALLARPARGAPRRRRDGLRPQPLRHRGQPAHLPGDLASQRGLDSAADRGTPRTPRWSRSRISRPPTAGSWSAARRRSSGGASPRCSSARRTRCRSRGSRRSPAPRTRGRTAADAGSEFAPTRRRELARAARRGGHPLRAGQRHGGRRLPSSRRARASSSSRPSTRGSVLSASSPRRCGSGDRAPEYRRAPARDEDRGDILRELLGYDPAMIVALERDGAFGAVAKRTDRPQAPDGSR